MKNKLIFIAIVCLISCTALNKQKKISFKTYRGDQKLKYVFSLPKGFITHKYESLSEKEFVYLYKDSTIFYITDDSNPRVNYKNIMSYEDEEKVEIRIMALDKYDTMTLKGISEDGKFWKDKKIGPVSIGYLNVEKSKVTLFEKSINSLKIK